MLSLDAMIWRIRILRRAFRFPRDLRQFIGANEMNTGRRIAVSAMVATVCAGAMGLAAPRKAHFVVLGAARKVPYSKAGDPAGAATGEDALKIRAAAAGWRAERVDNGRAARRDRQELRGAARDPAQRCIAQR